MSMLGKNSQISETVEYLGVFDDKEGAKACENRREYLGSSMRDKGGNRY